MELTEGTLLGGRVRYAQPLLGYRTGIEPVFLAAVVPARAGQVVLEAGTGAGAGLLCLGARLPGVVGVGVERDAGMANLCRRNLRENGLDFRVETGDVALAGRFGPFDHAFGNPPWHDPASTRSPDSLRDGATHRDSAGLEVWVSGMAAALRPGGTLTLVLPAASTGEAMALLLAAGLGRIGLMPLWPRTGRAAKIVLIQGVSGASSTRVCAGVCLHGEGAGYSEAADAVLRLGVGLVL